MSSSLIKLARRFTTFLNKKSDDSWKKDPLLKLSPERQMVEPEMTEELDQLVQDSLQLVILMQRSWVDFQREAIADNNQMGIKMANNVLLDLEDIEEALTNSNLLNFDLNLESGLLDVIDQNASMIQSVMNMLMDNGKIAPEFKKLDLRVFKWINELISNNDKMHDLAMSQSEFMENTFADKPKRMIEQEERDIDEVAPEELHPDYKEQAFSFEDPGYSGNFGEPFDPLYEKHHHGHGPRIRPNPKYKDDAEYYPILEDD